MLTVLIDDGHTVPTIGETTRHDRPEIFQHDRKERACMAGFQIARHNDLFWVSEMLQQICPVGFFKDKDGGNVMFYDPIVQMTNLLIDAARTRDPAIVLLPSPDHLILGLCNLSRQLQKIRADTFLLSLHLQSIMKTHLMALR